METMMETFKVTKEHLNEQGDYVGKTDLSNFQGNLEIAKNLGWVAFNSLKASGYIIALAGSGIEAGCGIKAGDGIKAGWGIEAGSGIEAGCGIKAGYDIKARWGIKAGWGIFCKLTLNSGLRIFAGLCLWRLPTKEETEIKCGKLEHGEICFGNLIETGLPDSQTVSEPNEFIELNGIKYKRVEI